MIRWWVVLLLPLSCMGCRSTDNNYSPYGPTCVPPPGTGAIGTPYYQPPGVPPQNGQVPGCPQPAQGYPGYGQPYQAVPQTQIPQYTPPAGTSSWNPGMNAAESTNPEMANSNLWNSSSMTTSPASPTVAASGHRTQPRRSGELVNSDLQLRRNENLSWHDGVQQASAGYYGGPVDQAQYVAPPYSGVANTPVGQYGVPSYGTEYVLDPYATSQGPYATESIGSAATGSRWTPRR